jgi:ATP-binding protein involved in chromosome partitioning
MSFFDVAAYLRDRGGPEARSLAGAGRLFERPGDERVFIFGHGGVRRRAEQMGVPFLGEVPLNITLREYGDEGQIQAAFAPESPSRPHLLGIVEQLAAQISIQNIKTPKMPKLEILQ